jgi:hypothetical protein
VIITRRRLPHFDVIGEPSFITFRLRGSLPASRPFLLSNPKSGQRTGQPFWQDESYDHLVRHREEFERIRNYIENNPVVAGLVQAPEQYLWSSKAA